MFKRRISWMLACFVLSMSSAYCETFVDYVPEGVNTTPISVKTQPAKTTTVLEPVKTTQQAKTTATAPKTTQVVNIKNTTSVEKAPALPSFLQNTENYSASKQTVTKRVPIELPYGTNFEVKSSQNIGDWTRKNTSLKFVTTTKQSAGGVLLPAGTVFKGHIVSSHRPQLTSNGGLIKIAIDEVYYQNVANDIKANIIKANGKKVYFSTMKGKRAFWKNTRKNASWGTKMFKKGFTTTSKFSKRGGIYWVLTPFPVAGGTVAFGANAIVAPVVAVFQKGGSISYKSGTVFFIQTKSDSQIYVLEK